MVVIAILIASTTLVMAQPEPKMTICHFPPGNQGNAQTITINVNAWSTHQEHGDTEGPCGGIPPVPETGTIVLTSMGIFGVLLVSRKYRQ